MPNASETAAFHVRREAHQTLSQIVESGEEHRVERHSTAKTIRNSTSEADFDSLIQQHVTSSQRQRTSERSAIH